MHSSPLTPVFVGLQLALHALMAALVGVVLLRAVISGAPHAGAVTVLAIILLVGYFGGVASRVHGGVARGWLAALTVLWLALVVLTPDAAYLAFGLFFLYLHLVAWPWNVVAVAAATAVAVTGTAAHKGWSAAVVIGPVIGACVAVVIGLGYAALFREAGQRQELIEELIGTRETLAEQEHTAGKLAERERLAQEIHDTVAQGLSSIQMLLHAAERSSPEHPAVEQLRMARSTAADSLAETRQLVAELRPAVLVGQSLAEALERICRGAGSESLRTKLNVEGDPIALPMPIEAALVRIAQGAVANVVRHAQATQLHLTLTYTQDAVSLDIVDNGVGFDTRVLDQEATDTGTFGLQVMRRRVAQLDGSMEVESEPNHTAVAVWFPLTTVEVTP